MEKKVTTAFMYDSKAYKLIADLSHINIYHNLDDEADIMLITNKLNDVVAIIKEVNPEIGGFLALTIIDENN